MSNQIHISKPILDILKKLHKEDSFKYHFYIRKVVDKYRKNLSFMDTYIENKDSINIDHFLTYVYKEYFDENIPYEIVCDICLFYVDMKTEQSIVQDNNIREVSKLYEHMKRNKKKNSKKIKREVYKIVFVGNMNIDSIDETRLN